MFGSNPSKCSLGTDGSKRDARPVVSVCKRQASQNTEEKKTNCFVVRDLKSVVESSMLHLQGPEPKARLKYFWHFREC